MSFFNLPERPKDNGHNPKNPGFRQAADHFSAFNSKDNASDDGGLDFEDTYDGLGDALDEQDDTLNDETFGGTGEDVGKDFDFYGQTAKVADAINEEQILFQRQAPKKSVSLASPQVTSAPPPPAKPTELKHVEPIPDLKPEMSLWATPTQACQLEVSSSQLRRPQENPSASSAPKKFMSLEEVEAQILAASKPQLQPSKAAQPSQPPQPPLPTQPQIRTLPPLSQPAQLQQFQPEPQHHPSHFHPLVQHQPVSSPSSFFDNRTANQGQTMFPNLQSQQSQVKSHAFLPVQSHGLPALHPNQSDPERARLLEEELRKLERIHKITQLARYNGLMTPADKNFITRIQLQQLVAVNEDSFMEDFYYQVYSAIRARNNPQQPLNQFAQTYLLQQGNNQRGRFRRVDNHFQRMEQQVHRAVAAAKARPKASQLVLEGSLGKISFSNVKTPRPLLNIQRTPENQPARKEPAFYSGANKKMLLKGIENIYDTLLELETHERVQPPLHLLQNNPGPEQMEWKAKKDELVARLWKETRIMDPIDPSSSIAHPFIAILSYAKGKKSISRMFRHIDSEQKVTILTMIVVHLDLLGVVKTGVYSEGELQLPSSVREEIEVFAQTVLPPLLNYVSDAPLNIVFGLLSLLLERVDVVFISKTRIGLAFLTTFISRAELIKLSGQATEEEIIQWLAAYDALFDILELHFEQCFPPQSSFVDDFYVWQFLASMAVGANMDQQQRLVTAVKDRVMATVKASKTLPPDVGAQKSANVNLFMRAMGLDVSQL